MTQTLTTYDASLAQRYVCPSIGNTASMSHDELVRHSNDILLSIRSMDWGFIKGFCEGYHRRLENDSAFDYFDTATDNIYHYLSSDDVDACRVREFLGPDINLYEFADMVLNPIGAMTSKELWPSRRTSIRRTVLSAIDNNMSTDNYIASVLFFGGRCCYCNRPLHRNPPRSGQASGEHITPISPSDESHVPGATTFGNMALCCLKCNKDRGNTELASWLLSTRRLDAQQRVISFARIQAFREYAGYREYTLREAVAIENEIARLEELMEEYKFRFPQAWRSRMEGELAQSISSLSTESREKNGYAPQKAWPFY